MTTKALVIRRAPIPTTRPKICVQWVDGVSFRKRDYTPTPASRKRIARLVASNTFLTVIFDRYTVTMPDPDYTGRQYMTSICDLDLRKPKMEGSPL